MPFNKDMIELTTQNTHFQQEVFLDKNVQIVLMHLPPGEDIGAETHRADQTTFFVSGEGKALLNGHSTKVGPNHLLVIPQGTEHNITNTGTEPLKLYSVYAPPAEPAGVSFKTKADAEAAEKEGVMAKVVEAAKDALHKVTG